MIEFLRNTRFSVSLQYEGTLELCCSIISMVVKIFNVKLWNYESCDSQPWNIARIICQNDKDHLLELLNSFSWLHPWNNDGS